MSYPPAALIPSRAACLCHGSLTLPQCLILVVRRTRTFWISITLSFPSFLSEKVHNQVLMLILHFYKNQLSDYLYLCPELLVRIIIPA